MSLKLILSIGLRCGVFALLVYLSRATGAPNGAAMDLPADEVRIELVEGVPDRASWNFTAAAPTESYTEPAFGFVVVPTKYSERGVKVDRAAPFVFRASARVRLPKGEHRLLLRARTGSRLFMDGNLILTTPFPDLKADGHEEVPKLRWPSRPTFVICAPVILRGSRTFWPTANLTSSGSKR